jgi:hypothetical protein
MSRSEILPKAPILLHANVKLGKISAELSSCGEELSKTGREQSKICSPRSGLGSQLTYQQLKE